MKPIRLKVINFLNPHWLSRVNHGTHFAIVINGRVELAGEMLDFVNESLPDGTNLIVKLDEAGFFVAFDRNEYLAERENTKKDNEERQRSKREEDRKRWALNKEFNDYYHSKLPFKWVEEIKDVLSGLSENSNGSGTNKRSVHHILCLEDVNIGRIKRERLDFLCTTSSGSNGRRWSGALDLSALEVVPRVSCRKCLSIADGIIKKIRDGD